MEWAIGVKRKLWTNYHGAKGKSGAERGTPKNKKEEETGEEQGGGHGVWGAAPAIFFKSAI